MHTFHIQIYLVRAGRLVGTQNTGYNINSIHYHSTEMKPIQLQSNVISYESSHMHHTMMLNRQFNIPFLYKPCFHAGKHNKIMTHCDVL